jgi:hypothetical protein
MDERPHLGRLFYRYLQRYQPAGPELSRAERFDAVVFLDLPGRDEKQMIWDLYLNMFEIDCDQRMRMLGLCDVSPTDF